jgi:hypothetical protein
VNIFAGFHIHRNGWFYVGSPGLSQASSFILAWDWQFLEHLSQHISTIPQLAWKKAFMLLMFLYKVKTLSTKFSQLEKKLSFIPEARTYIFCYYYYYNLRILDNNYLIAMQLSTQVLMVLC